jgi:hypothetical protein
MGHDNPLTSWDDFPVHQTADFIAHAATSDRNFYDRYYFLMHPSSDEMAVIFGLGQYPNLGVTDAFVAVRKGDGHHVVRASKPLVDRMDISVGPIRIEIIEPLRKLRVVVEPTEHSVSMDVTWTGSVPAIAEPNQFIRSKGKVVFDTQRLAQTGFWEGSITVNGETTAVTPDHWRGARDRSWGVRPVGEPEPAGIRQGVPAMSGMWNYFPMQFDDHSIFFINNELGDGTRVLEQSERVWPDGRIEQLGRVDWHHEMQKGTRLMKSSVLSFPDAPGGKIEIRCTSLLTHFLAVGSGYGLDDDWRHGMYQGPDLVVQGRDYKVDDIKARGQFAVVDHVARFEYNGHVGYGLYEQAFMGAFPRVGIAEARSMAE